MMMVKWKDFFVAESILYCLDALTGKLINSFGDGGKTTINKGFERNTKDFLFLQLLQELFLRTFNFWIKGIRFFKSKNHTWRYPRV